LEKIIRFRPSALDENGTDMIICTGHSNEVLIYQNGEVKSGLIIMNAYLSHDADSKYVIFAHQIGHMQLPWATSMRTGKTNWCWGFWIKLLKFMNGTLIKVKNDPISTRIAFQCSSCFVWYETVKLNRPVAE